MTIQEKLRKIRLDKGLSLQNIADELGVSQAQYSNIESGNTELGWSRLLQLAGVFKMDVIEVIIYGEVSEELEFVKTKIELYRKMADIATEDVVSWRKQAMVLSEHVVKIQDEKERLQGELDRIKKVSKSYSITESPLLEAAEPTTGKRKK